MLETKLSVPFYGQVRQYHNIKAEIDAKNPAGAGKRAVRDGTDAEAVRGGIGAVPRYAVGVRGGERDRCAVADV